MATARAVTATAVIKSFDMAGMLESLAPMAMKKRQKNTDLPDGKFCGLGGETKNVPLRHAQDLFHDPPWIRKLFILNVW